MIQRLLRQARNRLLLFELLGKLEGVLFSCLQGMGAGGMEMFKRDEMMKQMGMGGADEDDEDDDEEFTSVSALSRYFRSF